MLYTTLRKLILVTMVLSVGIFSACGDEDEGSNQRYRPSRGKSLASPSVEAREKLEKGGAGRVAQDDFDKATGKVKLPKIAETDFIESLQKRDPFKPFIEVLVRKPEIQKDIQREIKLEEYDIEQLRLIAIITNIGDPRAMVVTPSNVGIVLRRGDYVGKADFVDPGSGAEKIQINWKVHRIHGSGNEEDRGIYLVRDDPLTPTPDDITRFMPLYPRK